MGLKRLVFLVVLAAAMSLGLTSSAPAGNYDEQAMGCTGENPATCPTGTEGVPYTLPLKVLEEEGCEVHQVSSGTLPPGLSVNSDADRIEGTPTQAGEYRFFLTVTLNTCPYNCGSKCSSDDDFIIKINPGVPRLVIGPESAGSGTVGTAYSLQMTATVPDAKTWSIVEGSLPPGLAIGPSDGLISGTPTTAGTYVFTVRAVVTADARADTKVLGIPIRNKVAITAEEAPAAEVDVPFSQPLTATGGTGSFTWALAAGALPPGLALGTTGAISGTPTEAGSFRFTVSVVDTEGRTATLSETLKVASPVVVVTRAFRPAKVGRYFEGKLRASGGVQPVAWKLKRGPLPRGIRFDRTVGRFYGTPTKAGTWRVVVEVRDALRVASTQTVVLSVKPTKPPKKR